MTAIINATVKFKAGKIFPSKYPDGCDRQNILASLEDGREEKIYFNAGSAFECSLNNGDEIQIIEDDKGRMKIAKPRNFQTPAQQPTQPKPTQPQPPQQASRKEIAAYIRHQAKVFDYCLQQVAPVARKYDLEPGDTRAMATSVYIATQKKFNL